MKVGIIADDLTGANATGVKLKMLGLPTLSTFHHMDTILTGDNRAICIDTDSRHVSVNSAMERVSSAMKKIKNWNADIICKRIDSTFRGNIGQEIDSMLNELDQNSVAIIVPSYPEIKREVINGNLFVDGIPLQETDVSKDPIVSLNESHLPSILARQSKLAIGSIDLCEISEGNKSIEREFKKKIASGKRLIICDATTEEHIQSISTAMNNITITRLIPVDPGPLTKEIVLKYREKEISVGKILLSLGSITSVTKKQLNFLKNKLGSSPLYINTKKLASYSEEWNQEIQRVTEEAINKFDKKSLIIITTNSPDNEVVNLKKAAKLEGVTEESLAKRITLGLAYISKNILDKYNSDIKGCFFSGGDVTASFCEIIDAEGIKILDEVMPLVAYGKLSGGKYNNIPIITKGGLIGEENTIYESIQYLKNKNKQEEFN